MAYKQKLLATLAKVNKIPNINQGGCAYVAYNLSSYLHAKGIRNQIIYLMRTSDNRGITNLCNNQPDSCCHAVVKIGRYYYDSTGSQTLTEVKSGYGIYKLIAVPITTELALQTLTLPDNAWNNAFDKRNRKAIKEMIWQ